MKHETNHLGQPVGIALQNWKPAAFPTRASMPGHFCRLEPLDPKRHAESLFNANARDKDGRIWTYLPYGPFEDLESYRNWMLRNCCGRDPLFYAVIDNVTDRATGVASYLRIDAHGGSIEVGHLNFSPLLQHTAAATEAMYLMMARVFKMGYHRCEWKCSSLNAPSRVAAQRLGFSFEGIFRNASVSKGHNRDTAWYAIFDEEWPVIQEAFLQWLSPSNFDMNGKQKKSLSVLTSPLLKNHG